MVDDSCHRCRYQNVNMNSFGVLPCIVCKKWTCEQPTCRSEKDETIWQCVGCEAILIAPPSPTTPPPTFKPKIPRQLLQPEPKEIK